MSRCIGVLRGRGWRRFLWGSGEGSRQQKQIPKGNDRKKSKGRSKRWEGLALALGGGGHLGKVL